MGFLPVFVDFRKAFDLVNHNILFSKVIKQNIPPYYVGSDLTYQGGNNGSVPASHSPPGRNLREPCHKVRGLDRCHFWSLLMIYPLDAQYTNMWMTLLSQLFLSNLLSWANENDIEINTAKTKEMILGPLARSNLPFLTTPTGTIDRVTSFKLLGLHIDSSLSWANHTTIIVQKASCIGYIS